MLALENRILTDGEVRPGGILKVDGFLNHRIDPQLSYDMACELKRLYAGTEINKVLTIEASGIALACMTAYVFGCPLVFAKKSKTKNISSDVWSAEVESFTHGNTSTVIVSKEYLDSGDRVLIVDDFLATGNALLGLADLCNQAGATVEGFGICIEKGFQNGGDKLREAGYSVTSLAILDHMTDEGEVFFR